MHLPSYSLSGRSFSRVGLGTALLLLVAAVACVTGQAGETVSAEPVRQAAGDLLLVLEPLPEGIRLASLRDEGCGQDLTAPNSPPLFEITLSRTNGADEATLVADAGWTTVSLRREEGTLHLRWEQPRSVDCRGLALTARATGSPGDHAWRWDLRVENPDPQWTVRRVIFPQVAVAGLGSGGTVLFPRGPGEVQGGVWERSYQYHGQYPGGWCSMQFMAAYRPGAAPTGLYLGLHDPWGSTKDLDLASQPELGRVRFRFEHPAPNMTRGANSFALSGQAVWQLLRGDWFDAAQVYRAWARREARWWPRLSPAGREDTPLWMRELHVWAQTGGAPDQCVPRVQEFQEYLGLPAGFHWYSWHQIPFDNDYPHYFPAQPGFAEAVHQLQARSVFVMPYINGRLWDSRDRGAEDAEFTRRALAAATKKESGEPYLESYGSKETNGEPVRLAAMCPATPLWQQTVRDIVRRLLQETGTRSVYIDQVAAAAPTLCLDATHGHPLGGGHWWNEGYWSMLDAIRRDMPPGSMLTTECNGEPFVRWFDGYLTWHWQHDGQVPAFPAVYGGTIQMFGRAYRGGATKDLALRMKAGQQLVYGEQLGWIDPGLIREEENAVFFRQAARLRARFQRYFYAGEMARPPQLQGGIPPVKADWQWSGEWWVATDAVLTGAWRIPAEKRLVLLFANVSDQAVTARLPFQGASYGVADKELQCAVVQADQEPLAKQALPATFEREVTLAPRSTQGWELSW